MNNHGVGAYKSLIIVMFSFFAINIGMNEEFNIYSILGWLGLIAAITLLLAYLRHHKFVRQSTPEDANLKKILDELNIATWALDPYSGSYSFSSSIESITCCKARDLMLNPTLWSKMVHPYDILLLREADKELMAGRKSMLEYRIMLTDGRVRWIQRLGIPVMDQAGKVKRLTGLIIDVSEQKQEEENIKQKAYYDTLTGLANRSMLEYYFAHCQASSRHFAQNLAIVFIDLDSFKAVNDQFGHNTGDILLKMVAARLKNLLRGNDLLSRLGGDEFVVLLTRVSRESLTGVAERIMGTFAEPFEVEGYRLMIGASLGISIYPDDGEDLEILIHNADQAMYQAKNQGKNNYRFYS
ncbi:MAG: diguanylate cyclase [Syntrophomonas sp.]|nr:diguanylate cyclase [Syntrophomonadaceae bacterium]MDD3880242.1 diguanylate cyclase [Syntrophomonas sp.]